SDVLQSIRLARRQYARRCSGSDSDEQAFARCASGSRWLYGHAGPLLLPRRRIGERGQMAIESGETGAPFQTNSPRPGQIRGRFGEVEGGEVTPRLLLALRGRV